MKTRTHSPGINAIIILRIITGGHLFIQGMIKLVNPFWTSQSFLENSNGVFRWLSEHDGIFNIVDFLNIWGLILVGTALVLGIYERLAAVAGILLLGLYYLAFPPFDIFSGTLAGDGQGIVINATLIEIIILVVLFALPSGKNFGIRRFFETQSPSMKPDEEVPADSAAQAKSMKRRELIRSLGTLPILGIFGIPFMQRKLYENIDATSGATKNILYSESSVKEYQRLKNLNLEEDAKVSALREEMPFGRIGGLKISRMIGGSNLIGINMHARDLPYVDKLAWHYNTAERIMMTMKKMEEQGVNTIVLKDFNFEALDLKKYWTEWGGKMIWIADPITDDINQFEKKLEAHVKLGCHAAYIWGGSSDQWYARGEPDNIARALEIIKSYKIPAGIGAHYNEPIAFAIQENLRPDFIFKTLHHNDYWSAHPEQYFESMEMYQPLSREHHKYHDNLWCQHPEEFIEMIREVDIPFIAFKTMAAGSIPPGEAFEYAFQNGADFICAGMFDFQVEEDIKLLKESVKNAQNRQRPWIG